MGANWTPLNPRPASGFILAQPGTSQCRQGKQEGLDIGYMSGSAAKIGALQNGDFRCGLQL
jgi:hypothetical protein